MQTVPRKPTQEIARVEELTFGTQLTVSYAELTGDETGGSPILSYLLEIDSAGGGSGPWTSV